MTIVPLSQFNFIKNPLLESDWVENISYRAKEILNFLFSSNNFQRESIASFGVIAKNIGCSVSTVQRSIRELIRLGIIIKKRRFNASNKYMLHPSLNNPEIITRLRRQFKILYQSLFFNLSLILSSYGCSPKFDQLIKNFNVLFKMVIGSVIVRRSYKNKNALPPIPTPAIQQKKNNIGTRRGVIMSISSRLEVIRQIQKKLPLTEHGSLNLEKYPVTALQEAMSKLRVALQKRDPYIYLLSICESHCKINELPIDRVVNDREKMKRGIPHYDKHFVDLTQKPVKQIQSKPCGIEHSARLPLFVPEREIDEQQITKWQQEVTTMQAPNDFFAILQQGFRQKFETQNA